MTKLDEISRIIGNIEAELRGVSTSVAEVRQSSTEHHRETSAKLENISGRVAKIEMDMKPLAVTVATMEPIVAGYAVTRWKIAGAFALGTSIITALAGSCRCSPGRSSRGWYRYFDKHIWGKSYPGPPVFCRASLGLSTAPRRWSQRAASQQSTAQPAPALQPARTSVG
jgi:hypothetical protein